MKTIGLLSVLIAGIMLLTATGAAVHNRPLDVPIFDAFRYDLTLEREFEGIVASKGRAVDDYVYFPLKTADRTIEVQLGPKKFVEQSRFKWKAGEMATVIGMPTIIGGLEVLVAREIRTATAVFVARDRDGQPMWDPNRPIQLDPYEPESIVCEMIMP
jgi:hypothetical protein